MVNAACVLSAGPGEPDEDVFSFQDRLRLRDNFGFVLQQIRSPGIAFGSLPKGPWSVFIASAVRFQLNAEAWPGQEAIAQFSGCSTRAVRYHVAALERGGFLLLRRERRWDGGERIFYRPGPVMLCELAAFREKYPKDRPKVLNPKLPHRSAPVPLPPPPERTAGPPAGTVAMEPRDQDQTEPSSCRALVERKMPTRAIEQQEVQVTQEDEDLARRALAERMARKHPTRPVPRWFDTGEVALVAACAAAVDGDFEAKLVVQRDAIAGAFLASRDGPPTVRFIWGTLDHFFDHLERGRRKRLAGERSAKMRFEADRTKGMPRSMPVLPPRIPREQMAADLERLFGASWRARQHRPGATL
jgi:hypothetical protein